MTRTPSANSAADGRGFVTGSKRREVYALVDALLGERITREQERQLEELVCNDAGARRCYLDFITDSAMLRELGSAATGWRALKGRGELADNVDPAPRPFGACQPWGGLWHPTALLGPAPLTYAMAAIMLSVAVLAAWTWSVPRDGATAAMGRQAALRDNAAPDQGRQGAAGGRGFVEAPIVGTITQMADCRWADRAAAPAAGSYVHVGQKFVLSAGRVEITYRASAAARITLQAPVAYEVNSESSGFLSLGLVTVHTMQRATGAHVGMHRFVEGTLFSVCTPTRVLVDRGGQFTVLVDRAGQTRTRLQEGFVEVQYPNGATTNDQRFWPDRSSWAYVEPGTDGQVKRAIFGAGTPPLIAAILAAPNDRRTASAGGPLRLERRRPEED